jgi:propanediol dehydratase small subunit
MVRKAAIACLALAISGCARSPAPAEKAEADYNFIRDNRGSQDELCQASAKVADAYRDAHDAANWREWKQTASETCLAAQLDHQLHG